MENKNYKLLLGKGIPCKVNMHNHSHVSDSLITAPELKKLYMEEGGYAGIAYTDHDVIVSHRDLIDDKFVAFTGAEVYQGDNKRFCNFVKTCHMNVVSKREDNDVAVMWHRDKYVPRCSMLYYNKVNYNHDLPDYERHYGGEGISDMFRTAHEGGYFTIYNHPVWSCEDYFEYSKYKGMDSFEVMNYSSIVSGMEEYNGVIYDELLRLGNRLIPVAGDDNHNGNPPTTRHTDSLGAYTVIDSPAIKYNDMMDALTRGDAYASEAPEIKKIVFDNGKLKVECSPCRKVCLNTGAGRADLVIMKRGGEPIEYAEFEISPNDIYARISLTDTKGKRAYSRAYFADELPF